MHVKLHSALGYCGTKLFSFNNFDFKIHVDSNPCPLIDLVIFYKLLVLIILLMYCSLFLFNIPCLQVAASCTWQMVIGSSSVHTACGKFALKLRGLTNKLTSVHSLQKEAKPFAKHIVKLLGKTTFLMDCMNFLNIVVYQVNTKFYYFIISFSYLVT